MSAHTPGPWTVEPVTSPWHSPLIYAEAHVGPIAEIRPRLHIAALHPMVVETRNANARLIAAAPDLLAALMSLEAFCAVASLSSAPARVKARALIDSLTGGRDD